MVNVNKNIVPGKSAEKTEEKAPMRRPRNKALNSSKKVVDVRAASKGRQPVSVPLNSSKSLNSSLADQPLSLEMMTEMDKHLFPGYSDEEIERDMRRRYETAKENYPDYDEDTLMKQMLWDYFGIVDEWLPDIKDVTDVESMKNLSEDADLWADNPNFVDNVNKQNANSACSDKQDVSSSSTENWDKYYDTLSGEALANRVGLPVSEIIEHDKAVEEEVGKAVVNHYAAKPEYEEDLSEDAYLDVLEDGTVGMTLGDGVHKPMRFYPVTWAEVDKIMNETLDSTKKLDCSEGEPEFPYSASDVGMEGEEATIAADLDIDPSRIKEVRYSDDEYAKVYLTDGSAIIIADSSRDGHHKWADASFMFNSSKNQKMNCSEDEVADVTVTTESGNEISIKEIKVVQNPSTNELALYVPENEDDEIPDGFVVLGDVVATAAAEAPEEEVEEPEEGELDASKKKN